jgi:hypothetical protein
MSYPVHPEDLCRCPKPIPARAYFGWWACRCCNKLIWSRTTQIHVVGWGPEERRKLRRRKRRAS